MGFLNATCVQVGLFGLCFCSVGVAQPQVTPILDGSHQVNGTFNKAMAVEYSEFIKSTKPVEPAAPFETEMPIDSHEALYPNLVVVRGGEGIVFPDISTIDDADLYTPTPSPEPTATPLPTHTPWQKPLRCQDNSTKTSIHSPGGNPQVVWQEKLFVYDDFLPLDTTEVYGIKVKVYPYDVDDPQGALVRMRLYEVPCVPYRIRYTDKAYHYDMGLNALKNYDSDQTGKGKIHPWIAQKVFGAQNKKPHRNKRFRVR